jgi:hypothetical protein
MSNDNVFERLWKLQVQVNRLVLEGKRDPKALIGFYQGVMEEPTFDVKSSISEEIDYRELTKYVTPDGKITLENFKKALKPRWNTWKTIKLGTLKNVEEIRQALKASGNSIGDWANDILGKPAFTVSETEQDAELVNVSVGELGFKDGARYADICKRANELGLGLCPAEVGPQLRLQFKDQPKSTYVVVTMEAITGSGGDLSVFYVERCGDGDQCLSAIYGYAGCVWDANLRFGIIPKKVAFSSK